MPALPESVDRGGDGEVSRGLGQVVDAVPDGGEAPKVDGVEALGLVADNRSFRGAEAPVKHHRSRVHLVASPLEP